ncbi:hypothetical protein KIPB_000653 [Kipferlia bialata]|uniref:Uncharacterized protein n=1 Tax=Kipferlia bialata TaxID=797122 RepID=A0A9K3CPE0_9EUKA|nr:hypothetical protein KIPB_000653 [Kipferlia bialata]|eukprot:g653.t1
MSFHRLVAPEMQEYGEQLDATTKEYMQLDRRFKLLEGDRKAHYENSKRTIREHTNVIDALRKENRQLKKTLLQLENTRVSPQSMMKELDKLNLAISELRRKLDNEKSNRIAVKRKIDSVQTEVRLLDKEIHRIESASDPDAGNIRKLETQLDQALIKKNEAQSVHRTYQAILQKLTEERATFDSQLAALNRVGNIKSKDLDDVRILLDEARNAAKVAKTELEAFSSRLEEDRRLRQSGLEERRGEVEVSLERTQRQADKRQERMRAVEMAALEAQDRQEAEERLASETLHVESEPEPEMGDIEGLTPHKAAFMRVVANSGINTPEEFMEKYMSLDSTRVSLEALIDGNLSKVSSLKDRIMHTRQTLSDVKFGAEAGGRTRRVIEQLEEEINLKRQKADRARDRYSRAEFLVASLLSGARHIADTLRPILPSDETPIEPEEGVQNTEALRTLLLVAQDKLMRLRRVILDSGGTIPQGVMELEEELGDDRSLFMASNLPSSNKRIDFPDEQQDIDTTRAEEPKEKAKESVIMDRESIKRQAQAMAEREQRRIDSAQGQTLL